MAKSTPSIEETVSEMLAIQTAKDTLEEYVERHYQEISYKKLKVLMKQAFEMEQIYEDLLSPLLLPPNVEPACTSAHEIYQTIIQTNNTHEVTPTPSVKMEDNRPNHKSTGARASYKDIVCCEYYHCKAVLDYLDSLEKPSFGSKRSMTTMLQTSHLKAYLSALKEIAELFELKLDD